MMSSRIATSLLTLAVSAPLAACDLCAISGAVEARDDKPGLSLGFLAMYSHGATLQQDSTVVANTSNQHLYITDLEAVVGWRFNQYIGVRAYVPWLSKDFQRPDQFGGIEAGARSGLGDMSVEVVGTLFRHLDEATALLVTGFAGLKLPTGNSDALAEGTVPGSGVHGHDLALGSGSTDEVVGASLFARWQRLFVIIHGQYDIRNEGAHHYQYANELDWGGGPGYYLWLGRGTVGLQLNMPGLTKGSDQAYGFTLSHSGMTELYLGPLLSFTWESSFSSELGFDLPVIQHNTGLQVVNDYRAHLGANWRF